MKKFKKNCKNIAGFDKDLVPDLRRVRIRIQNDLWSPIRIRIWIRNDRQVGFGSRSEIDGFWSATLQISAGSEKGSVTTSESEMD